MPNAWDVQMLGLEQRSRTSMMRPLEHPPRQTIGEMRTDVLLSSAFNTAQTWGKLENQSLGLKTQELLAKSHTGEEFQTLFDEQIRPKTMITALVDPMGSASMLAGAEHAGKMLDITEQRNLEKLGENLTYHNATSLLTYSDNINDWNSAVDDLVVRLQSEQTVSPAFRKQMQFLKEKASPYFNWKSTRTTALVNQYVNQYSRDVLNNLGSSGVDREYIDSLVQDFDANVLSLVPKAQKDKAKHKFIADLAGEISDPVVGLGLLEEHKDLFKPKERTLIKQKSLMNSYAAKNLKAADRKNLNAIAQENLDTGQIFPLGAEEGIQLSSSVSSYNDFLAQNKPIMGEQMGLGPAAYQNLASNVEDQAIKSALERTSARLATDYQTDFWKTLSNEQYISSSFKDIAKNINFALPEMDPETGDMINSQPMLDSLGFAANAFSEVKYRYFPGDRTLTEMVPENAKKAYQKVYKSLNDAGKWDFISAASEGLRSSQPNLQGMWPHRQVARMVGDKSVAGFSVLANTVNADLGKEAFTEHLGSKALRGKEKTHYNDLLSRAKLKISDANPNLSPQYVDEIASLSVLRPEGRLGSATDNKGYIYIKGDTLFTHSRLKGLVFLGKASGVKDSLGSLKKSLSNLKIPGSSNSAWDAVDNEITLKNGKKYRGMVENVAGSYSDYMFSLIDENGQKVGVPGGSIHLLPNG